MTEQREEHTARSEQPGNGRHRGDGDDGWSRPALYGRGLMVEPRTFTEFDPVPAIAVPDWQQWSDDEWVHAAPQWSAPTYFGKRKYRPQPTAADQTAVRTKGLLANTRTMAIASLTSRVTGFMRSIVLAAAIGVGAVGDAYNGANNFPNMVYELLIGGVLSSVLIPLLVNAQEHDPDRGEAYTQRLLSFATVALGLASVAAVAAAPLIALAFVSDPSQRHLTAQFAALLLPEIFFYGIGAMFTAVLNTKHVYGPGAWAPVFNNVIVIATLGIFILMPGPAVLTPATITTSQVLVLGIGTTLGIVGQTVVLIPYLRRVGFRWKWRFSAAQHDRAGLSEVGQMTGWVIGYVVASQIGVFVIIRVAFTHRGVSTFTFADLLFQVPYGILGVSLLTALMPRMSRAAARGETDRVVADLSLGARLSAVALLPITTGLMVLGPSLTTALFGYGQTSIAHAHQIGVNLAMASFGLLPFALVMLQLRVFYAMRDARTPTIINICMVGAKVVLVLIAGATLHGTQVVEALNVSTSISYVVGAVLGHFLLKRRFGRLDLRDVWRTTARVLVAAVAGAGVAFLVLVGVQAVLGAGRAGSLAATVLGSILGLGAFVVVAWRLRISEVRDLANTVRPSGG